MGSTTRLRLRSRATRLAEGTRRPPDRPDLTGLSPSTADRSRSPVRDGGPDDVRSERYNSGPPNGDPDFGTSSALFIRHYWGHPGWFLFLRLLICLNSAGDLARVEVEKEGKGRRGRSSLVRAEGGDGSNPIAPPPPSEEGAASLSLRRPGLGGRGTGFETASSSTTGSRAARAEPFGGALAKLRMRRSTERAPTDRRRGALCVQSFEDSRRPRFVRTIALRCVLPRRASQGIRR